MPPLLTRAEVELQALQPGASLDRSALSRPPYLLIDAASTGAARDETQQATIVDWLLRRPCPVIALAGRASAVTRDALLEACDVVVPDSAAAASLLANIERTPLAALVLVQVLRASVRMPLAEALLLESLAYAALQSGPEFRAWLAGRRGGVPVSRLRASDGPPVLLERHAARLQIRLNRPERRNAISVEMRDALVEAFELVKGDATIERVEVSGAGACFSTGGDLEEFGTCPDPATGHAVRTLRLPAVLLASCASRVQVRLHGACIGAGMELPAFAARVTAERNAFFQLPELRFGLIPGAGGCVSLPRRIGRQRTAYLALSGRRISAATALEWGLVDALVDGQRVSGTSEIR